MLDRMRLVAEAVEAEEAAKARAKQLEHELAGVRSKAGGRLKALVASNKGLEEEVARWTERDELNQSKMRSLEACLAAVEGDHVQSAARAQKESERAQQDYVYARALVIRYLELEDQHEALFPALASAFKLTQHEVQRIQHQQQVHAASSSLWGRTFAVGSRLVDAAKVAADEVRSAAQSQQQNR